MHIADPGLGIFGANGIVGAGLPIAVGAATARHLDGRDDVVVAFFGDGSVAQGLFHEAVNLAALWRLPVVFLCENNGYAEFSTFEATHPASLADRARGYGIPHLAVDGNDVEAMTEAMGEVVAERRAGAGPVLLEARTYRLRGHYEGDPERYRSAEEVGVWKDKDPIARARHRLAALGVTDEKLAALESDVLAEIEGALARARAGAEPDPVTLTHFVTAARPAIPEPEPLPAGAETFRTMDAIRLALEYEMVNDPDVFLAGIDIGAGGNVFGLTRGLHSRWPERVRDTPISESVIVGLAVGAAMAGKRPVVELMYLDFLGVCLDQLMNQAAKLRFMTGGLASMPLVLRTQFGAGRSSGSQHSQSLEALLAHIPGLTVVMPSTPAETYGLLRAAIRDPNPVVFIENRLLYGQTGPRPPDDHLVPIGRARVVRPGRDVTVVSVSRMVHEALAAAETLAAEGIEAEVIDLRTVAPLDRDTVLASLSRTGRLVIAHEAVLDFGIGAELAALAAGPGFWHLDAPVARVGAAFTPAPYAPSLEHAWLPDRVDVAEAIRTTVRI
jgi:2-oxoisovalerate dehydrogenase E1 component